MSKYTTRFNDAPWMKPDKEEIILGGAGGIGSWVALTLGRIGHEVYVYDMDNYDENNLGGQFCKVTDVDWNKAVALKNNVQLFGGSNIYAKGEEYTEDSLAAPIMIAGFDNMEARKIMYENWKSQGKDKKLWIDARMSAEFFEVFVVTDKKSMTRYEKDHMFPSSEANVLPCSFKSTTHNAMGCAYIITGLLNNFIVGDYKEGLRELPFHTKFDIGIMMFEINN